MQALHQLIFKSAAAAYMAIAIHHSFHTAHASHGPDAAYARSPMQYIAVDMS